MRGAVPVFLFCLLCCGCSDDSGDLATRGERVYRANCIACHNMDPAQEGVMGPAVAGARPELIEARVLRGEYPPGYRPKRETALMQPLPYLKDDIPALAAYLAGGAE